jgi:predicted transcriptional regulator
MRKRVLDRELSDTESLLMKIIWDYGKDIPMQDLMKELKERYQRDYARTTVATFMAKIIEKGFITTYRIGRNCQIHAEKSEAEYKARLMSLENSFWFNGSPAEMVRALIKGRGIPASEAEKIRNYMDEIVEAQ